jgi:phage terminase large subunit-like protein
MLVSTACPDWEDRIVAGRSLIPFAPLFQAEADAALAVFKSLVMVDVPGQPTFGRACDDWVFDFVAAIFGAYDHRSAKRVIREFLLLISKKNSKSTIAAGIMVTALIRNWRHSAALAIVAPTIEVANNSFGPAAGMVRADPELLDLLHVIEHQRMIRHRVTGAELKIIAADSDTAAGMKAGFVLVDELWLFGKKPKAAAMLREVLGGLASRPEGFVVYLTTHSDEPPAGVFKDKLQYFRDVRDGRIIDPASLGVLYEWPAKMLEDQAYLDPANFRVTNPNLGRSVDEDWLLGELKKALQDEGEGKQIFLAKHLNVEIGLRLRRDRWRGADFWEQAGFKPIADFKTFLDRCEVVVVGVDGGGLDDLLGFCALGRDKKTKAWLYWSRAFAHRKVMERRKEIASLLRDFEQDGDLVFWGKQDEPAGDVVKLLTEDGDELEMEARLAGDGVDPDIAAVVQLCVTIRDRGLLPEAHGIGADPAAIGALLDALVAAGFTLAEGGKGDVVGVSQSATNMFSAINTLERKLEGGTAAHGGTRLMAFCVSNAKAELRGNAVAITKAQAGKAKIDPLVAAFVATKLMERNPEAAEGNGGFDGWLERLRA